MNVSSPSEDLVGVCPIAPFVTSTSDGLPYTEIFYVGNRPILVVTKPTRQDHQSEKLVTQISHANDANALRRFAYATESYFTLGQLMQRALTPVFEILSRGLYVVHVERMIPTDGAGNFFLNAYSVRREIRGTAEINSVIGATKNYAAPFLIPTQTISQYSEQKYTRIQQLTRSGKYIGGLAYHVSGLFCALLEGHHAAMASVMEDKPFNCLVIEPVRSVIYEDEELTKASGQTPRITALSCPNVKIPLNILPHDMLEDFLTTRHESRPEQYEKIKGKLRRNLRNIARRRYEPEIYDKVRFYPNVAMIESASSIGSLNEEDLQTLATGAIKDKNDRLIISENHFNSVATAFDYLQYKDFNRMIRFAEDILKNKEQKALHRYIVDRLCEIPENAQVYRLFLKTYGPPKKIDVKPKKKLFKSLGELAEPSAVKSPFNRFGSAFSDELKDTVMASLASEIGYEDPLLKEEASIEEQRQQNGFYDLKELTDKYIVDYEAVVAQKSKRIIGGAAMATGMSSPKNSEAIKELGHAAADSISGNLRK